MDDNSLITQTMRQFQPAKRLIRNWFWYVVFWIVQNHGE